MPTYAWRVSNSHTSTEYSVLVTAVAAAVVVVLCSSTHCYLHHCYQKHQQRERNEARKTFSYTGDTPQ